MAIQWLKMNGPSLRDAEVMVNRMVAEQDVQAYKTAGYKMGHVEGNANPEDVKDPNAKARAAEAKQAEKDSKTKEK